jgi:hypothetical protein
MTCFCKQRWHLSEELRKLKKGTKAHKVLLDRYEQHLNDCLVCRANLAEIAARSKPNPEFLPEEAHA